MSGIKKAGWVLLICCSVLKVSSQAPGYMGKRFSAGYGIYANPAFNSIGRGFSDNAFNTLHELFIECALDKKFSLGLSAQFFRYKYNNKAGVMLDQAYQSVYSLSINSHPSGSYLLKGRNYKLYGKFFKDRYLAPWGKYFTLGISLNQSIVSYNPDEMGVAGETRVESFVTGEYVYQDYFYNDFGPTRQTYKSVDIFFGNGNSRVIANTITLDYGYTIGCLAMTQMFIDALDLNEITPDNYIERTAKNRSAAVNRFNFYLKIGYLF
ncbi:hypothetical protein CNR22_09380 [Sphingobacteriaceae bacterium]|nr:hypothetical protein CNR22_09380 [Sphingobacteriaceae bacterium]